MTSCCCWFSSQKGNATVEMDPMSRALCQRSTQIIYSDTPISAVERNLDPAAVSKGLNGHYRMGTMTAEDLHEPGPDRGAVRLPIASVKALCIQEDDLSNSSPGNE